MSCDEEYERIFRCWAAAAALRLPPGQKRRCCISSLRSPDSSAEAETRRLEALCLTALTVAGSQSQSSVSLRSLSG